MMGCEQQAKSVTDELKLSCGVWDHCADPPMFALRILLMVLDDFAKLLD